MRSGAFRPRVRPSAHLRTRDLKRQMRLIISSNIVAAGVATCARDWFVVLTRPTEREELKQKK